MKAKLREIAQVSQHDPVQALIDAVGDVSGIEVMHNLVLVATYIEPERTPGGVIKPDSAMEENRFQGKAGLVLALGPLAFKDDDRTKFGGMKLNAGDWVIARPSDGLEMLKVNRDTGGAYLRLFEDINIKARVSDPALIY